MIATSGLKSPSRSPIAIRLELPDPTEKSSLSAKEPSVIEPLLLILLKTEKVSIDA